jgi:hypothetical protein
MQRDVSDGTRWQLFRVNYNADYESCLQSDAKNIQNMQALLWLGLHLLTLQENPYNDLMQ